MSQRTRRSSQARRQLKRAVTGRLMIDGRRRRAAICALCGFPVLARNVSMDHIQPVSLGGSNAQGNLRPTHARCNAHRGNTR